MAKTEFIGVLGLDLWEKHPELLTDDPLLAATEVAREFCAPDISCGPIGGLESRA